MKVSPCCLIKERTTHGYVLFYCNFYQSRNVYKQLQQAKEVNYFIFATFKHQDLKFSRTILFVTFFQIVQVEKKTVNTKCEVNKNV